MFCLANTNAEMGGKNLREKLLALADQLRLIAESITEDSPVRTTRSAGRRKQIGNCTRCHEYLPLRARGACDKCYQRITSDILQGKYTDEQAVIGKIWLPKDKPGRRPSDHDLELADKISRLSASASELEQRAIDAARSEASPQPDAQSPDRIQAPRNRRSSKRKE